MKKIIVIFILLTSTSVLAWFFNSLAEDQKEDCYDNDKSACEFTGFSYLNGTGFKQNYHSAQAFFRKGCYLGSYSSCYEVAMIYKEGKGTPMLKLSSIIARLVI